VFSDFSAGVSCAFLLFPIKGKECSDVSELEVNMYHRMEHLI